jgi:hypothetical protein
MRRNPRPKNGKTAIVKPARLFDFRFAHIPPFVWASGSTGSMSADGHRLMAIGPWTIKTAAYFE